MECSIDCQNSAQVKLVHPISRDTRCRQPDTVKEWVPANTLCYPSCSYMFTSEIAKEGG